MLCFSLWLWTMKKANLLLLPTSVLKYIEEYCTLAPERDGHFNFMHVGRMML